jgi:RNA polymerase subunit RPABC4/transcription elongation factor Spt4
MGFMCLVLVFALVGYAIGSAKGRTTAGLLWGALVGPIGWLVVAVGPNMKPKCSSCGGVVVKGAQKCLHCGSTMLAMLVVFFGLLMVTNSSASDIRNPGDIVTINHPLFVVTDLSVYQDFWDAAAAKDQDGILEYFLQGQVVVVSAGEKIKIISTRTPGWELKYVIRILTGDNASVKGYINYKFLDN